MADIVTHAAILGRGALMPGIQPVDVPVPPGRCLVKHAYHDKIVDEKRGLDLDVADCTIYSVTHIGTGDQDVTLHTVTEPLFEQALQAISEVTIWSKTRDLVGKNTAFTRQVGRLDVKVFLVEGSNDTVVGWVNPLYIGGRDAAAFMAGFLGNMVVQNGPAATPVSAVARRAMAALDLINLGFYTESFVSVFALTDDLVQEVLKAGLSKKGLGAKEQDGLMRAIKEERLRRYLTDLAKLCDWKSLADENPELLSRLAKANTLRNNIVHGPTRLGREQTLTAINTLFDVVNWLRSNPFGFAIPTFPLLQLAEADFKIIPLKPTSESPTPSP